jgi:hypothetical protein
MRNRSNIGTVTLALWMVLFIPTVTAFHYHNAYDPGGDKPFLSIPTGQGLHGPDYPPCDVCARLAIPAMMTPGASVIPLSINFETGITDNCFRHSSHLFSPITSRAPPPLFV